MNLGSCRARAASSRNLVPQIFTRVRGTEKLFSVRLVIRKVSLRRRLRTLSSSLRHRYRGNPWWKAVRKINAISAMIAQKRVSFSNHREEVLESHEVELLLLASIPGYNLGMTEQVLERNLPCLLHPPLHSSLFLPDTALHTSSSGLSVSVRLSSLFL